MPLINITEVFDNYLMVIDIGVFWTLVAAYTALLAVAVPWLANRPQPKPHPDHWEWIDGRTDWKKTVR